MEVSNLEKPAGQDLLQTVVNLTGLPENLISKELDEILEMSDASASKGKEALTLEDLRAAMLAYLESIGPELTDDFTE